MAKIFSVQTAMRLFKEESSDLALCHENMIEGASKAFEAAGDYASANDIWARYYDCKEELDYLLADLMAEFA